MKNLILLLALFLSTHFCQAQYFQATINTEGNDLIFSIRANPGGGDITTDWSDIEFFVRWPSGTPAFTFDAVTMNGTNFPGVPQFARNLPNFNGQDAGFDNAWFGSSFTVTPSSTYTAGVNYEVFRVTLNVAANTIPFTLVHNEGFAPTYLALTSGTGAVDRTNPAGNKFYGVNTSTCTNCPGTGTNHLDTGVDGGLPVDLISFDARPTEDKAVQLTWITASELNNDFFTVERSIDGRDFEEVAKVVGAGTTALTSVYQTYDEQPNMGMNYYRLKQTDFDGAFEYSDIKVVEFESLENEFSVFPNPTSDVIHVRFNEEAGTGSIQIFSVTGKLVHAKELNANEYQQTINLSDLPKGSYWLQLERNGLKSNRKIIVQ